MPRFIVKLTDGSRDYYLEWSTVVDAPVTYGMTLDELRAHIKERYGSEGLRELPERLARVEAKGTSCYDDHTAVDTIWLNRAGAGESALTYSEIVQMYCKRAGEIVGHQRRDECWSPELFDDRTAL